MARVTLSHYLSSLTVWRLTRLFTTLRYLSDCDCFRYSLIKLKFVSICFIILQKFPGAVVII